GVVHVVERRHKIERHAAELALEDGDVVPRVVRFVLRCRAPEVVPVMTQRLGGAHDLPVEEVRRHELTVTVERAPEEIGGPPAETPCRWATRILYRPFGFI